MTRLDEPEASFDLIVDRGLLMSLFGERARRAYAATVIRSSAEDGSAFLHQWELPRSPRVPSPGWLATTVKGLVVAPGEIEDRLGDVFLVERLRRSIERTDDPGIRRLGVAQVAKTSYWLRRRPPDGAPRGVPASQDG